MSASHLDFYRAHHISPVRQDISDLERHFERREALFRHLGILPQFIEGRKVLEVGPGSGHNAIYVGSLGPGRYLLVEGNPTGIEHMNDLFARHPTHTGAIDIVHSTIEDWELDTVYDFVFCEGLLSGVSNPEEILGKLGDAVTPGGVLTITCVDHLSHFPETIRRAFADKVIGTEDTLDQKVAKILPMVEPHLNGLQGMSRRYDDWVIDNLIHPGSIIPLINIPQAISFLDFRFDYYGGSPHFVSDWRWYKSLVGSDRNFNRHAIDEYWSLAHNLMDYRMVADKREPAQNIDLYALCTDGRAALEEYEKAGDGVHMGSFIGVLDQIVENLKQDMPLAAAGIEEASRLLKSPVLDPRDVAEATEFSGLFGRGQQYISLIHRGDA